MPKFKSDFNKVKFKKDLGTDNKSPVFCFDFITTNSKYNFENLTKDEKLSLIETIYNYKNKSWLDIKQENRHNKGSEKIKIDKSKIPDNIKEDTVLLAIRFDGLKPMIGFRDGRMFNIIFFDAKFNLYNH